LLQFDRIVKPEKGLKKVIRPMVTQPVTAIENNKEVTKYALYYSGEYVGYDAYDNEIYCSFNEGWYFKPKLEFLVYDIGRPFDPKTSERRGGTGNRNVRQRG
jgi:hypothetical protein